MAIFLFPRVPHFVTTGLTSLPRHCEERSDEAIQQAAPPNWIASLALAMTTQNLVLATHARPSFPNKSHGSFRLQKNEGRRSADRRNHLAVLSGARQRALFSSAPACAGASDGARSPLGAPPRHSPHVVAQPQAAFPKTRFRRALPAYACLSPASSSQTGRSAGRAGPQGRPGAVCETARGDRPHPAIRIASGMRPSWVRYLFLIADLWWVSRKEGKGRTAEPLNL
jgi:hypothetical protein